MQDFSRRLLGLLSVGVAAVAIAACGGGDDNGDSGDGGGGSAESAPAGRTGGEAKFAYASFPDYLDPALSYTVAGWQAMADTNLPLLTYKRTTGPEGATLIPALAEAMPEVTDGGKTYSLTLRDGLKYSDGSAVKAGDFEHTIKRVINLESGGSSFYTSNIAGAEDYQKAGKAKGDISGITSDDATRKITIKLVAPSGQFPFILAMDFAGIVPGDTPFENMTKEPPPGVGPFKITTVQTGRSFVMERNDQYPEIEGLPAAKLDKITINAVTNDSRAITDILQNKLDYFDDMPTSDALREFREKAPERYRGEPTNSTYYFFLNHRVKPFDDPKVRQAVAYAVDKRALVRLFGGLLEPDCNFLPSGMQGYQKVDPCPYGDPKAAPDIEKAKQLIQEAGVAGQSVSVYGNDEERSRQVTEYLADVLEQIGLKPQLRIVNGDVYFQTIGNQKTKSAAGFANWFQ
ncbi:MAG: peptide/nickel transport system substrate-binding protein, partial [Solirubrobacteraceae bacterium]|nr:peptide/nickel transport system substrate-binding protein [Solirubrobacteraceae bacterium]